MFYLITETGKWLTSAYALVMRAEFVSAYTLQSIRTGLLCIGQFKPGAGRATLKFFFGRTKLPQSFAVFNPAYKWSRKFVIEISGFLRPVVTSKKTGAVLSGLTTATALSVCGCSFPIILAGAGFSMWAGYRGETRQQAISSGTTELGNKILYLRGIAGYEQEMKSCRINGESVDPQVLKEYSYTRPTFVEMAKIGLDLSLSGIAFGASSYGFMFTLASCAYTAFSEVRTSKERYPMQREGRALIAEEERIRGEVGNSSKERNAKIGVAVKKSFSEFAGKMSESRRGNL